MLKQWNKSVQLSFCHLRSYCSHFIVILPNFVILKCRFLYSISSCTVFLHDIPHILINFVAQLFPHDPVSYRVPQHVFLMLTPAGGFPLRFPQNSEQREFRKSFQTRDIVKKKKKCNLLGESIWHTSKIYVCTNLSESDLGTCLCTRSLRVTAQGKYSLISSGLQISVWWNHGIWFMITFSRQVEWPKTLFNKTGFKQGGREDCQEKVQRDLEKRKILKANVWEPSWENPQLKFH